MLALEGMNTECSTYAYFKDREQAAEAVRTLNHAGFHFVDIEEDNDCESDTGQAPPPRVHAYVIMGGFFGLIFGMLVGAVVFGLPVYTLELNHGTLLLVSGLFFCGFMGTAVGVLEGLEVAKRNMPVEPPEEHGITVTVCAEDFVALHEAEEILGRFTHPVISTRPLARPMPRSKRWSARMRWQH